MFALLMRSGCFDWLYNRQLDLAAFFDLEIDIHLSSRRHGARHWDRFRTSSRTSKLPDVLVVDANVLLSALIGGRAADALAELGSSPGPGRRLVWTAHGAQ